ncbi:DUF1330 domain-containing protein [Rhodopseudomonas sp. BR0M22]|uniref:DUF1330 domain-containing protein n=1 Tax=Rhodopseudomonas sp. BR0M22 TaxID=2269369 RepID=UPI0013E0E90A|nr:DUF1330 domain-containing protein [Rhodopseudomonas sp. BR0M22]MCD0421982.1 DUF1330 domain-containing protein [Rubrivivax sp. JA1024]NEW94385.1 DUF1330 domain-containing protein [Rhodopseudomonas sp. BR0M22]
MSGPETISYIEPTQDAGRLFVQRDFPGPVVMLNLLRFNESADYSGHPELAPAMPITGAQAFDRYVRHTLPFLRESGGDILFLGEGRSFLIGPADEQWDLAMLIRQASVASFLSFASHAGYLAGLGHRAAAVKDSRLLPLSEMPLPTVAEGARP